MAQGLRHTGTDVVRAASGPINQSAGHLLIYPGPPISGMAVTLANSATPKVIFAMKAAHEGHPGATVVIDSARHQDGRRPSVLMLRPYQGPLA
jgi:hypothetical protein